MIMINEANEENGQLLQACKMALGFLEMFKGVALASDRESAEYKSYAQTLTKRLLDAVKSTGEL